ncbi:hypothetical protein GQ54DRAFT_260366, partial [Martensiomyces pterosporus]
TTEWLDDSSIEMLDRPSQLPDVKLINHILFVQKKSSRCIHWLPRKMRSCGIAWWRHGTHRQLKNEPS